MSDSKLHPYYGHMLIPSSDYREGGKAILECDACVSNSKTRTLILAEMARAKAAGLRVVGIFQTPPGYNQSKLDELPSHRGWEEAFISFEEGESWAFFGQWAINEACPSQP